MAIENLREENDINISEFKSLAPYRKSVTENSTNLLKALRRDTEVSVDTLHKYLFYLVSTSTPDLQYDASDFYLNSNYNGGHLELKKELLSLKTYLKELMEVSAGYQSRKSNNFMSFLRNAVDFDARKVVNLKKLQSIEFKNIIWIQYYDELELNRLYRQATTKLDSVQVKVESILNSN